jgi:VWFA-related protein
MVMHKWALCLMLGLMLAGAALPVWAANRVTVIQLEKILSASKGKSDAEVARQLGDLELTERLSSARMQQLRGSLPGEKSQQALVALADTSAFLDPPSTDMPATATPDAASQRRMMALTVDYLGKTLPLLPNLFAARDTMRFESRPEQASASGDNPLRVASKARVTVLYRNGREFVDAGADKNKKAQAPDKGLTTWGEFGPILGTVLIDAAHSRLNWSHWELGAGGPQAVFHYSVPKEKSHYDVRFCCVAESYGFDISVLTQRVGYHGEITVDPDSGTILRLTVLADIDHGNPIGQADIAVEYGPVEIGGRTYYCPVRGIALAQAPDLKAVHSALSPPPSTGSVGTLPTLQKASLTSISNDARQTLLNDVAFREFHLFRADSKVTVPSDTEAAHRVATSPETQSLAASGAGQPVQAEVAKPSDETAVDASTLAAQPPAGTNVAMAEPAAGLPGGLAAGAAPEASIPEITIGDATGVPSAPALAQAGSDSAVTLRLSARLVDVPLVALDKKGRPITNLKPEDLEIYDEGHKVDLRSFAQAGGAAAQPMPSAAAPGTSADGAPHAFSNHAATPDKSVSHDQQGNTIVLLIDNTISFDDLSNARDQMKTFLNGLHGDERVALYAMRAGGFQILQDSTVDHVAVATTLAKWTPSAQSISLGQEQEARNRQTMDYVHNTEDLLNVNGHEQIDATSNEQALDPQLRTLGDNPGRDAFAGMAMIARHLGAIPGHKSLVWIASDNTLADWTNGSLNIDKGARIIQSSVLRAQEAMNDAHVSVYPLDASRLEAGGIDASIGNRNVALNPTATANQVQGGCGVANVPNPNHTTPSELTNGGDISTCADDLHPGRAIAQMQQDLHPIQGAYRELADATGGRVFRRASDMVSEFNSVVADGRATYLLSFTPAMAADGKYHLITVKVAGRKDVKLQYRTGFFYREEPTTIKDRFSQTVLDPEDATAIGLTADPISGSDRRTVKLDIAATDLEIAQKDAFWTDKLDVYVVQREVSGTKARVTGQTMGLRLKPATYQQYLREGIPFNQVLEVAPGVGSVRIVVVDENSGRMGSVTIPAAAIGGKL